MSWTRSHWVRVPVLDGPPGYQVLDPSGREVPSRVRTALTPLLRTVTPLADDITSTSDGSDSHRAGDASKPGDAAFVDGEQLQREPHARPLRAPLPRRTRAAARLEQLLDPRAPAASTRYQYLNRTIQQVCSCS